MSGYRTIDYTRRRRAKTLPSCSAPRRDPCRSTHSRSTGMWGDGRAATIPTQSETERWAGAYSSRRPESPVKAVLGMLVMALLYRYLQPGACVHTGSRRCAGGGATAVSHRQCNKQRRRKRMLKRSGAGVSSTSESDRRRRSRMTVGGIIEAHLQCACAARDASSRARQVGCQPRRSEPCVGQVCQLGRCPWGAPESKDHGEHGDPPEPQPPRPERHRCYFGAHIYIPTW